MIIIPADSFGADLSMLAVCLLVSVAVVVVVVEMLIYSPLHSSRSLVGFVYLYLLFWCCYLSSYLCLSLSLSLAWETPLDSTFLAVSAIIACNVGKNAKTQAILSLFLFVSLAVVLFLSRFARICCFRVPWLVADWRFDSLCLYLFRRFLWLLLVFILSSYTLSARSPLLLSLYSHCLCLCVGGFFICCLPLSLGLRVATSDIFWCYGYIRLCVLFLLLSR